MIVYLTDNKGNTTKHINIKFTNVLNLCTVQEDKNSNTISIQKSVTLVAIHNKENSNKGNSNEFSYKTQIH